jgi:hypothetical protein
MNSIPRMALPKQIKLKMQPVDLESAVCNSRSHCAIAQTLYRELALNVGRVRVRTSGVSIAKDGYRYHYRVPTRACRLIVNFDKGEPVQPIAFTLQYSNRSKIAPVPEDRKAQVNAARQARIEALAELGQKAKTYPKGRYGI